MGTSKVAQGRPGAGFASRDSRPPTPASWDHGTAAVAVPTPQATTDLGQLRQTLFMGTTLRGMLLNAYAFATLGTIAMWAAMASFIGAAVMLTLGILGLHHAHKVEGVDAPAIDRPATV